MHITELEIIKFKMLTYGQHWALRSLASSGPDKKDRVNYRVSIFYFIFFVNNYCSTLLSIHATHPYATPLTDEFFFMPHRGPQVQ